MVARNRTLSAGGVVVLALMVTLVAPAAPAFAEDPWADIASATVSPGSAVLVDVFASDGDGDPLSFALDNTVPAQQGTPGTFTTPSCDPGGCTSTITYTADSDATGSDQFGFTVSDGTASVSSTVFITFVCGAVITNGTVKLGINCEGSLNAPGGDDGTVGIRYVATNNDATAAGCECEGWGVGDATSGDYGWANKSDPVATEESVNMTVQSFSSTPSTATSKVRILNRFEVTHTYEPAPENANLYRVSVAVKNVSGATAAVRYRRVMDWDVEPTPFSEFVTMRKGNATELVNTTNNGFDTANPLSPPQPIDNGAPALTGSWADQGPQDHGAMFQFNFGSLAAGATKSFTTYYGAAPTETAALAALTTVGAEAYSLGQADTADGPTIGTPNTFMFAFKGVGGTSVFNPTAASQSLTTPVDTALPITLAGTHPGGLALTFSVLSGPSHGTLGTITGTSCTGTDVKSCTANLTYTPAAGYSGPDAFTFQVSDGTRTASAPISIAVGGVVSDFPTATDYTGAATVQYSDVAALSATLLNTATDPGTPLAGQPVDFTVGTQEATDSTDVTGLAEKSLQVLQQPGSVSEVEAAFAGATGFLPSNATSPFSVTKEDCTLDYTGPAALPSSGTVSLKATFGEPDSSPGNLAGRSVKFSILDVDNAESSTSNVTSTTNALGVATKALAIPGDLARDVYFVKAVFAGDAFYKPCTSVQEVMAVATSTAKVTGGGWIAGTSYFGFNVIPSDPLKGQLEARGPGRKRFHGSKVTSLEVTGDKAVWKGTGRMGTAGGYQFVATVEDKGKPGVGKDTFKLVVREASGAKDTVYNISGVLAGGNITIH
jgi:hypothetical protein